MIDRRLFKKRAIKDWVGHCQSIRNHLFHLSESERTFYHQALSIMLQSKIPFLIGGAYAYSHYTGVIRHTKDLDVFVRPGDCSRLLDVMSDHGYRTEITFRHWIGKIWSSTDDLIDVIYSSGNGVCEVDDAWFEYSASSEFLGLPVRVVPCEEMIWSKGYILERNRYDGADVAHLLRAQGPRINWARLLDRFGSHWRILYSHIVLFGFIYPDEPHRIPPEIIAELTDRMRKESELRPRPAKRRLCQGTLLSHSQYAKDLDDWGYRDARLAPEGDMTPEDIRQWTAAFADQKP